MIPTKGLMKILLVVLVVGLLLVVYAQQARAQSGASCQQVVEYLDLDADGQPEAMVLACQFSPDTNDQLTIYKNSGNLSAYIPWQENIAYEDETWVFDHGSQGKASLIIHFREDGSALVAEIYDDRDQDGEVLYEINDGQVVVTEIPYWTVRVVAADGWWMKENELNYNLHISIDGPVEGMFMSSPYLYVMATDGKADVEIQIYDQNHNGRPEFDKRKVLTPFLQESVGLQAQMMANWADNELPISGGFTLWPYLDLAHDQDGGSGVGKGYFSTPPPIKFSPGTGRIEAVSEFVASRGGEHNCFIYSATDWFVGEVNRADFENPFCFYDLAEDNDRVPELQVRVSYWFPHNRSFLGGAAAGPYEAIRYSWDQENSQTWRYAVGLVGRHLIDTVVTLADLQVLTIPYDDLPAWVIERTWDMAVFSEFTGISYFTSEGNYSVSYPEGTEFSEYFMGRSEYMPLPDYAPDVNFKMEWAMDHMSQPYLYFSPVDYRLHLRGATGGAWNLGEENTIRYANLDGDTYLDQWQEERDGILVQELNYAQGFFVYGGNDCVTLKMAEPQFALFEALPPTNYAEWQALGQKLQANSPAFAPGDFTAMMAQFDGQELHISSALLRGYRPTTDGFRFILALGPGFVSVGPDWLNLADTLPGEYLVTYDGEFGLQPLTPVALRLEPAFTETQALPEVALQPGEVPFRLYNDGLEDSHEVLVDLSVSQGGEVLYESGPLTVTVYGGESMLLSFPWAPDAPGEWQLSAEASWVDAPSAPVAVSSPILHVAPAQQLSMEQTLGAFGLLESWQTVLLMLVMILAAATVTGLTFCSFLAKGTAQEEQKW
ncbi:MAG: hypothetical protein JW726_16045 [Anaerolineales bacterium]|nr:hypothetical protein [Anaerolineales bacterium]